MPHADIIGWENHRGLFGRGTSCCASQIKSYRPSHLPQSPLALKATRLFSLFTPFTKKFHSNYSRVAGRRKYRERMGLWKRSQSKKIGEKSRGKTGVDP